MSTKLVMAGAAVVLSALGLAASFLPQEVLFTLELPAQGSIVIFVQLLGALYLGFGLLNWMARGILIGGIYARPVAMGNFMHFFVGAMALVKVLQAGQRQEVLWALAVLYTLLALLFGILVFRHPLKG
ncbi:MAG: hypothetical protein ACO1OQ_01810 [Rufibacter sp.]